MEEVGVRLLRIVPGAFGSVPRAESTRSPVPSILSTPTWELRAGQDHPTPVLFHDAFFLPGAESSRDRPALPRSRARGRGEDPPGCGRATRCSRALTQVAGSPSRLAARVDSARRSPPRSPRQAAVTRTFPAHLRVTGTLQNGSF